MGQEKNYQIEIKICSEAIFTSGETESNLVQSRAQTDVYGFVYFHAKTLKGQLKRQAFWLLKQYAAMDSSAGETRTHAFYESIVRLFGINKAEIESNENRHKFKYYGRRQDSGLMKLSNLELDERLRTYFIAQQKIDEEKDYCRISPHDLIAAQNHIRTGIQLENGVAKNKMLNTFHTVRKGLTFYSTVSFEEEVNSALIDDLARIVYSFRRIGAGSHRGRGEIEASLLIDGKKMSYDQLMSTGGGSSVSLQNC